MSEARRPPKWRRSPSTVERHLLDPELVAEARRSLIENHELLCEPACSSDLENDILLEL
jgi:hypothetical protein